MSTEQRSLRHITHGRAERLNVGNEHKQTGFSMPQPTPYMPSVMHSKSRGQTYAHLQPRV